MAYQAPQFYFYHSTREGVVAGNPFISSGVTNSDFFPVFDSRQAELLIFSGDLTSQQSLSTPIDQSTESDAIDTLILSTHNLLGVSIDVTSVPSSTDFLAVPHLVTTANRQPLVIPLDTAPTPDPSDTQFRLIMNSPGAPTDGIVPEFGEVFFTIKREMERGPKPNWQHPWVRSQIRFINQAGVSSTWLTGNARKTFRLTWENVTGNDLQILLDMRTQTANWSHPFWFRPPDDTFPFLFVELDRDSDWEQVFEAPLTAGTGHEITLPLIEALG